MNRITKANLDEFRDERALDLADDKAYERFSTYCVVFEHASETFDIEDLMTGAGDDLKIDGIGIFINGVLVSSPEEVDELCNINRTIDVDFFFVQAKTSTSLDTGDLSSFGIGVKDFFSEEGLFRRNETIRNFVEIQRRIFEHATQFRHRPTCRLFFVYDGALRMDEEIQGRLRIAHQDLTALDLFQQVTYEILDADRTQNLYARSKSRITREIEFNQRLVLPRIEGVKEAHLGIISAREYLKLISDDSGNINRGLFEDNIRDFQGDNEINKAISETIKGAHQDRFVILNNGVTIVATELTAVGNRFIVSDYQVVNGCQTSNVIYENKDVLTDAIHVPLRLIVTDDEDVSAAVTGATNGQNAIKPEDLSALSTFQRKLERFYASFSGEQRLYFERRPRQYASRGEVEKVRIISRPHQIRVFAAMFLDQPHRASRYYGTLVPQIDTTVFNENHALVPYYASGYALYRLEALFRRRLIDAKFRTSRYQMLMIVRYRFAGADLPQMHVERHAEQFCGPLLEMLRDDAACLEAFSRSAALIDELAPGEWTRDTFKTQQFTDTLIVRLRSEVGVSTEGNY